MRAGLRDGRSSPAISLAYETGFDR